MVLIAVIWQIDGGKEQVAGVSQEEPPGPTRYLYAVADGAGSAGPSEDCHYENPNNALF